MFLLLWFCCFSPPVCGTGVTTALATHWILSEASAVRHRLERIFLAPNTNSSSRKYHSVKRIHMENVFSGSVHRFQNFSVTVFLFLLPFRDVTAASLWAAPVHCLPLLSPGFHQYFCNFLAVKQETGPVWETKVF